ncbi:MAG: hypothetical protein ACKVP0_03770 [Pirellulaceae bacterium]
MENNQLSTAMQPLRRAFQKAMKRGDNSEPSAALSDGRLVFADMQVSENADRLRAAIPTLMEQLTNSEPLLRTIAVQDLLDACVRSDLTRWNKSEVAAVQAYLAATFEYSVHSEWAPPFAIDPLDWLYASSKLFDSIGEFLQVWEQGMCRNSSLHSARALLSAETALWKKGHVTMSRQATQSGTRAERELTAWLLQEARCNEWKSFQISGEKLSASSTWMNSMFSKALELSSLLNSSEMSQIRSSLEP